MLMRDFQLADADQISEILKVNDQYSFPGADGPEAVMRVEACGAGQFLVCGVKGKVVGVVRGNYDGSTAMTHHCLFLRAIRGKARLCYENPFQRADR